MLNNCTIMGRLTRDPELKQTNSGTSVANFTIAVDRDFADKESGEKQTDFIDCVAWRGTAEFVSKYFRKGSMAVVNGRLQIRNYESSDGVKRRAAEIVVNNVYFGGGKNDSVNTETSQNQTEGVTAGKFTELTDEDGDLPF